MPLESLTLGSFLDRVSEKTPSPGGGAVTAAVGALGAALAHMVVAYSSARVGPADGQPPLADVLHRLSRARGVMLELAEEDAQAYAALSEALRLPKDDPRRSRELPGLARAATQIPMAVMAAAAEVLRLIESLPTRASKHLKSDLAIAAVLSEATARAARWTVSVNVPLLEAEDARQAVAIADKILASARERAHAVEAACV